MAKDWGWGVGAWLGTGGVSLPSSACALARRNGSVTVVSAFCCWLGGMGVAVTMTPPSPPPPAAQAPPPPPLLFLLRESSNEN